MQNTELEIKVFPRGISTVAGGTRTAIKTNRPWQVPMEVKPKECPFHDVNDGFTLKEIDYEDGWRVRQNRWTPFPFHRVVYPPECWEPERLYALGGVDEIRRAFRIATHEMPPDKDILMSTHIGYSAGQNYGHLHWHVLEPIKKEKSGFVLENDPSLRIFESPGLSVIAGGHRAGQCFIVPYDGQFSHKDIAIVISKIVELYRKKFFAPDYCLGLRFQNQHFIYGFYVPILNNWGATEYLGLLEGTPITLPWPHSATVEFLKE